MDPIIKVDLDLIPGYVPDDVIADFRNHMYHCFKCLGLGTPSTLQYAIAEELQHGPKDFLLQAGRGMGKSVILSMFASWLMLLDPNTTILVCSATSNKAIEFVSMTRQIFTLVPYMRHLEPGDHDKDSAFGFNVSRRTTVSQDLSIFARGITSQLTGSHAFWIFGDDLEAEGKFEGAEAKAKLVKKTAEFEQIKNPGPGGVRLLGTPQDEDSVYNKLPYPVTKFPTVMPDVNDPIGSANVHSYVMGLGLDAGSSTDPQRFSDAVLAERESKIGPKLFSLHYKLDTSLADMDTFPLRLKNLIVMDVDPKFFPEKVVWASSTPKKRFNSYGLTGDLVFEPMWISDKYTPYKQTVMFVDPSGKGKDETAIMVMSVANGYLIVHELLGLTGGYDVDTLMKISKLAYEYNIKRVVCESNFGSGMFSELLRPVIAKVCGQVSVEDQNVTGQKEQRIIDTLEPLINAHRLVFNTEAIKDRETQYQITRLKRTRGALPKDDRVDVLGFGAAFFVDMVGVDVDTIIHKNETKEYEEMVEAWSDDTRRSDYFKYGSEVMKRHNKNLPQGRMDSARRSSSFRTKRGRRG